MDLDDSASVTQKEYDYLLSMPMWSLSQEKVQDLNSQMQTKQTEYNALKNTHPHHLWETDLKTFLDALDKQEDSDERDRLAVKGRTAKKTQNMKQTKIRKVTPKQKNSSQDVEDVYHDVKKQSKKPQKNGMASIMPDKIPTSRELSLRERLALKAGMTPETIASPIDNPSPISKQDLSFMIG